MRIRRLCCRRTVVVAAASSEDASADQPMQPARRVVECPPPQEATASGGHGLRQTAAMAVVNAPLCDSAAAAADADELFTDNADIQAFDNVVHPPAPAPALGQRSCGTEATRQASAALGSQLCWNCGAEQLPPIPAARPAMGRQLPVHVQRDAADSGGQAGGSGGTAALLARQEEEDVADCSGQARDSGGAAAVRTRGDTAVSSGRGGVAACEPVQVQRARMAGRRSSAVRVGAAPPLRCLHCGTEETPRWRVGPEGRHTLCNACGVRFIRKRIGRPGSKRRRVAEMRQSREESTIIDLTNDD